MAESVEFAPKCWTYARMGDFQSEMSGQRQIEMGFFGVEPSTIMARIVWPEEGCRRLRSQLPPHTTGQELYSHD